ncbi:addiction module toxin RelE [Faecalibacterium prausnitzii]|uniref:Addiction module toxin RelE n=3 Tax=Oscillospiraceae TaxID=216572 RepID=A0A2A7ATL3_9FIRM|nr:addiction module toxin RelE [Faecalibacterium prausnitzii]RAW63256.1 type II toxin-antitoxin system RelE/ParE family toxin [Faecalibacterium hattorii]
MLMRAAWWMVRRHWKRSGGNMDCEYHFQLTERARRDVRETVNYIRNELDNEKAAKTLLGDINKCMEKVCAFPASGALVVNDFLPRMIIRKKVVGNYVLYYMVEKEKKMIWVLRIVYGARNMEAVLKNLSN